MYAKTKKISLSDRFGKIKPQDTLQEKVNMNSELVKRLQQKISNVVQTRQGHSLPESLAEKIGKDETECEDLNRRRDGTFSIDSDKFQNMKVQLTVNAKRSCSLTSVASSKTPEKVETNIGNHHSGKRDLGNHHGDERGFGNHHSERGLGNHHSERGLGNHHGDERGLGKENNLHVSDHRKSNEQLNSQTNYRDNCVKDTNKPNAFTKSSYVYQKQGIEFPQDRFQGGINISPGKRKQVSQLVPPFVKDSHSSTYDVRKTSPNLRNQEAFSPADRYLNKVDNEQGHYNCQEGNPMTTAPRDHLLHGTDTVMSVNVHSGIQPCSSSFDKSGKPTVNVSDCTSLVYKSPLEGNYSKTNEYSHCDNIPSFFNSASPNYGPPLNQNNKYNNRNTAANFITPLNQNRKYGNRNDFQGQQTSQPVRNRDGSFQNQQVHFPFNHHVLPRTTIEKHNEWKSRVTPQESHRRIHQNIQPMTCSINSTGSDMPMQNQNGFRSPPFQTNAIEDASSDHNTDNHMGYYQHPLKRSSPFKTPNRVMIPAKKRMINEYLGQKSNDERSVEEMATHEVARKTSSGNALSLANNEFVNTSRQKYSYEAALNPHNKIKTDFQQEYVDVNDWHVSTGLERETSIYHEKGNSVSPCKDYMFDKQKQTAFLEPKTNAPSGFYRELSKENHSPERHQTLEGINDVKTQQFPQKKLFNPSTVKDQLVDTLLMQCQGLVEKENDRKALETIFDIIKKETNSLSSETKVNCAGNGSMNSGYKHENGCTEKDISIEENFSKDRDVTKDSKSKILLDCSLKRNKNQANKVLEMTSDVESKFSPTLSSPDYYAKPNSSMKFEGRTLLKGGVVPRHIPKNLLEKFLKNPPTDPRCRQEQRNQIMELPMPLFFIDFVETVKKKKAAKQMSVELEKSRHSGQVMKREPDSNINVHLTVPSGSVDKCIADNKNMKDNLEIVDMDIVCETKNEETSSSELQGMCTKNNVDDVDMFDSIDLVLQAAKIIPKSANQNTECVPSTISKPCDPRLKHSKNIVKTDDLKIIQYPCFDSNYENGKQTSEDQEARRVSLGCIATNEPKRKESTKSHVNVEKHSYSKSRSPDRNRRVNRSYSRDHSKSNLYDSPRYRSVKGSQNRNNTRRRKSEETVPCREMKAVSPKHLRRESSRETSQHRIGHIANYSQNMTRHCEKEWSRRETFVVETKSRSDFEVEERFHVEKNSQSQPNNLSPDTYKFIERRSSARNFKHSDSCEQFYY